MKINLTLGNNEVFSGFTNIDPIARYEGQQKGDILNLDWIVESNTCQVIRAIDIVDYIDISQKETVLQNWVSKLQKDGIIVIGGYDLYLTARSLYKHEVTFQEASNILYGPPDSSINKSGLLALAALKDFLKALGIRITSTKLNGCRYLVEGIKQ